MAEVMHGPIRLVHSGFPVLAFLNEDEAFSSSKQAVERLIGLGADVFTIGAKSSAQHKAIGITATGHGLIDPLVGLAAYYSLIERVALARGLDPDKPMNLSKVTETV